MIAYCADMPSPKVLVTFLEEDWPTTVELADRRDKGALRYLVEVVRRARSADVVILLGTTGFSHRYVDVLAALAIKRFRRPPAVIMTEATWELGSAALGRLLRRPAEDFAWLARAMVRAFDGPHVTYTVLASWERDHFQEHWGVPVERVEYTPWWSDVPEMIGSGSSSDVFAGGNSLRDYTAIIAAARALPDLRFRFATTNDLGPLPANVEVVDSSRQQMFDSLHGAGVVAAPLRSGGMRASGQFTYLSAMAAGKLVIVPDVLGVRDYIEHRRTGIIVPADDHEALTEAIRWSHDPSNAAEAAAIGTGARAAVHDNFLRRHYVRRLLELAARATTDVGPSGGEPVSR